MFLYESTGLFDQAFRVLEAKCQWGHVWLISNIKFGDAPIECTPRVCSVLQPLDIKEQTELDKSMIASFCEDNLAEWKKRPSAITWAKDKLETLEMAEVKIVEATLATENSVKFVFRAECLMDIKRWIHSLFYTQVFKTLDPWKLRLTNLGFGSVKCEVCIPGINLKQLQQSIYNLMVKHLDVHRMLQTLKPFSKYDGEELEMDKFDDLLESLEKQPFVPFGTKRKRVD